MSSASGTRELALPLARLLLLAQIARQDVASVKTASLASLLSFLSLGVGGARHSFASSFFGLSWLLEHNNVEGYVAPGFERVKDAFVANVMQGHERGAQFVVYHRGVKVVDLHGGAMSKGEYTSDSIQVCFSCSKVVAALLVARAVQKGLLRYDEPVATYWPEFAQNGKADITVADVLRHDAGLAHFGDERVPMELAARHRLDELAEFLARQPPLWDTKRNEAEAEAEAEDKAFGADDADKTEESTAGSEFDFGVSGRMYHGVTRGFVLNELVRRTDPQGRSMGVILREELAEPLGLTMVLGQPTMEEKALVSPLVFDSIPRVLAKSVVKEVSGEGRSDDRRRAGQFFDKKSDVKRWLDAAKPESKSETHFNEPAYHDVEIPSANVMSNARSLGKLADLMSRKALLDSATHDLALGGSSTKYDHGLLFKTTFTQGGLCKFDDAKSWDPVLRGFAGWGGFGGSQVAWHEEHQIGMAYTLNGPVLTSIMGFRDARCLALTKATMRCVQDLSGDSPAIAKL